MVGISPGLMTFCLFNGPGFLVSTTPGSSAHVQQREPLELPFLQVCAN